MGPYEILALIGSGGMGEVWKARDTRLGRTVAIKLTKAHYSARFEQEARAIAALNHPHICTLHDVGPDYLVMEYVDGEVLKGPLPVERASQIGMQIADALEAAHKHGILHRDLKPGNVMVTETGAKLLDFGLAKVMTDSDAAPTMDSVVSGTAAYMSPEQAQGHALDPRSDIFSFGAVLYELLSGRRAFERDSVLETLNAVVKGDPVPFDSPLFSVVKRCLSKNPSNRYQNMKDLKDAFRAAMEPAARAADASPSIAVLPFANMSREDDEYFSDGLAEEIINALTKIPGLKVIARTSAFAFKGQNIDIRKIAEILGVSTVLEGSVRKAGNRIRVTAQLIAAADGTHLWSERYDRELADVFEVQDEIAAAIANELRVKLSAHPGPKRYTPALAAYEAYLKARHNRGRLTRASIALYQDYLRQAIALDPNFALAHVDMADSYLMMSTTVGPAHDLMPQVRAHAQKALDLDPSLPEAQAMMGVVSCLYDYDWSEGQRRFGLAMAQEPVPPQVRQWYGFFARSQNLQQRAVDEMRRGLREDPLNILSKQSLSSCLLAAGNCDEALHELRECIKLDPELPMAYFLMGLVEAAQGSFEAAERAAEKSLSMMQWPLTAGLLAALYRKTGKPERAAELIRELGSGDAYGAPIGLAYVALMSGDLNSAAQWLRRAVEQRHTLVIAFVIWDPVTAAFRASSHWPALAGMMNLPLA